MLYNALLCVCVCVSVCVCIWVCVRTRATLMSPGKDERSVCGYIWSEFIHWAVWRTLMRTEYFLFVHNTTSILAKLSTRCFEHSGDLYSLNWATLTNPGKGERRVCGYIYIYALCLWIKIVKKRVSFAWKKKKKEKKNRQRKNEVYLVLFLVLSFQIHLFGFPLFSKLFHFLYLIFFLIQCFI